MRALRAFTIRSADSSLYRFGSMAAPEQLSQLATNSDSPPSARIADLRRLRDRTSDPAELGQIESYIGSLELQREAEALDNVHAQLLARENADIREELLGRGLATPEELDAAGFLSHEELDARAEDGTLMEGVLGAFGAALNPELLRKLAAKRRRNHGRFASEFSKLVPHTRTGSRLPGAKPEMPEPPHSPGTHPSAAIDVGGDVEKAAQLLAQGAHVRLQQPHQVSTLLDKLAAMAHEAESKGEKAPNFDLCKVSVPGTNLFCADTKGYGRVDMPQLSGIPLPGSPADALERNERGSVNIAPAFRDYLERKGVKITDTSVPASHLRASQKELNGAKVAGIAQAIKGGKFTGHPRLFVSNDDYIVDGHHRWAANVGVDSADNELGDIDMDVAQVDMPITDLIDEAKRFAAEMGIPPKDINTHANVPEHPKLKDDHSLYIKHDPEQHPVVPVENLHLTKSASSQPDSVREAIRRMNVAAEGKGDKRKPIDVIDNGDGTFTVKDGNATTAAAKAGGLRHMPVNIIGSREPQAAEETRHVFEPDETQGAKQNFGSQEKLYAAAEEAKPDFDNALGGEGESLAADIGALVPKDFDEALANAEKRPDEPQIILAPLKGLPRATEKVETKYDGDWDKLQDVVRGTVVVPHLNDMPAMIESLRKRARAAGFEIRKAENRYVDGPEPHNTGPTPQGYRDMAVALVHPNGTVTELQLQTNPMFRAKEGEGHTLYEESRTIEADLKRNEKAAAAASPGTTPASPGTDQGTSDPITAALKRLKELTRLSEELYQGAYEASYA